MRVLTGIVAAALAATSAAAADLNRPVPPPVAPAAPLAAFHHLLPACSEPAVLKDISRKFTVAEANIIHSGLAIAAIDDVRQTGATDGPSLIDRRYCSGRAWLSNGKTAEVVFLIEGPMLGKYSIGYSVDSCLPSFDPYHVYDGNCLSIRPQ
jgi:hypothetical protein